MPIKQKLNVLEIDRPLKQGETAIDIFTKHLTQYDLLETLYAVEVKKLTEIEKNN